MQDNKWTISNLISVLRAVLAIPTAYFLWIGDLTTVLIFCAIAYITDILDGFIARKFNQVSEWGKVFDPLADKIFIGMLALIMIIKGDIPVWFAIAVLARDLIILAGGLWAKSKLGFVIPSNYVGKATVIVIGLALLGCMHDNELMKNIGLYIALLMMIISLLSYLFGMISKLKENTKKNN